MFVLRQDRCSGRHLSSCADSITAPTYLSLFVSTGHQSPPVHFTGVDDSLTFPRSFYIVADVFKQPNQLTAATYVSSNPMYFRPISTTGRLDASTFHECRPRCAMVSVHN